jgi:hypothetical protein
MALALMPPPWLFTPELDIYTLPAEEKAIIIEWVSPLCCCPAAVSSPLLSVYCSAGSQRYCPACRQTVKRRPKTRLSHKPPSRLELSIISLNTTRHLSCLLTGFLPIHVPSVDTQPITMHIVDLSCSISLITYLLFYIESYGGLL